MLVSLEMIYGMLGAFKNPNKNAVLTWDDFMSLLQNFTATGGGGGRYHILHVDERTQESSYDIKQLRRLLEHKRR